MADRIPKPTEYMASLYRPELCAPDCDVYVLQSALVCAGVKWRDNRKREIIVPFDIDTALNTETFVFIRGTRANSFALAMKDAAVASVIFGETSSNLA